MNRIGDYPIRLVKDLFKRSNGNGVPGSQHLRPRRDEHRVANLVVQSGRAINEIVFPQGVSPTGNGDSLVSDGGCEQYTHRARLTRSNTFSRVAQGLRVAFCVLS